MISRIEIDGFKTFQQFRLNLGPFSAIVGANATGKSNLFDALRFLASLAQTDLRSAMQELRGQPEELFRRTPQGIASRMAFAVEVLLPPDGIDSFGTKYSLKAQRLRYEVTLALKKDDRGFTRGIVVEYEACKALARNAERDGSFSKGKVRYSGRLNPFITTRQASAGREVAFEIRQDGPAGTLGATKRGRPVTLPAYEATRTALSTITTAEFPHLYALRDLFATTRFLEINPQAARAANDRFESKVLRPDASNLAAVLNRIKQETSSNDRPEGALSDISLHLASLIRTVRTVQAVEEKEYAYGITTNDGLTFSSRVISDGTLRLLALLSILDDPERKGILCFEEPENGVHEGRIPALIKLLRSAASIGGEDGTVPIFQVLVNTHSPAVMEALKDEELVAADTVTELDPKKISRVARTRMRSGRVTSPSLFDAQSMLSRSELQALLRRPSEQV